MKHKIQVVMLPTEDNSHIAIIGYSKTPSYLDGMYKRTSFCITQHVYITVSQDVEPIKEGDYAESGGKIMKIDSSWFTFKGDSIYRKIIATTDPKLTRKEDRGFNITKTFLLPQLQQQFLKEFVANPDGKWEVEYEKWEVEYEEVKDEMDMSFFIEIPKLNQDNTVTITSVEEEKMYSREEMIAYGNKTFRRGINEGYLAFPVLHTKPLDDNWIKENL